MFSQAAVVAIDPPRFEPLRERGVEVGFSLVQDFRSEQWPRPCNYFYRQRFDFYRDGRFRPWAASYGRACSEGATYRPVTRIEFADMSRVAADEGGRWVEWSREGWRRSRDLSPDETQAKLRFTNSRGDTIFVRPLDGAPGARENARTCASCHDRPEAARREPAANAGG
ncbi:MAG: hypothetical protein N3F11_03555 [Casimicrobiaceae bacterium]|nr:hypothetical protein [Casimicrobiaceae bacterium]